VTWFVLRLFGFCPITAEKRIRLKFKGNA